MMKTPTAPSSTHRSDPVTRNQSAERLEIDKFLDRQVQLGFQPKYMVSFHYRSLDETLGSGTSLPAALTSMTRHTPKTSAWNQVGSYNYYCKHRNDPDSVSRDNQHIRNLILQRHYGIKHLKSSGHQVSLLFFLEYGIGVQLHCHLLIPQPLPEFDDDRALAKDWKRYITSHAKCLSRQREPHVRLIDKPTVSLSYVTKETCPGHLSLDFMASIFPEPIPGLLVN